MTLETPLIAYPARMFCTRLGCGRLLPPPTTGLRRGVPGRPTGARRGVAGRLMPDRRAVVLVVGPAIRGITKDRKKQFHEYKKRPKQKDVRLICNISTSAVLGSKMTIQRDSTLEN